MDDAPPALLPASPRRLSPAADPVLPALVAAAGDWARTGFLEFFASAIRNPHTRRDYARAVGDFLIWCEEHAVPSIALSSRCTWRRGSRGRRGSIGRRR